jgi:hypothetical protein
MRIAFILVPVFLVAGCAGAPVTPPLPLDDGSYFVDDATLAGRGYELSDAGLAPASEDVPRLYAEFVARQRCPDDVLCGAEPVRTVTRADCSRAHEEPPPEARCTFRLRMTRPGLRHSMTSDFSCVALFAIYPEGWRMYGFAEPCEALPILPFFPIHAPVVD